MILILGIKYPPCVCFSHNSFHVLSRDNVARVRRDEAEARAVEEEKAERAALAVSQVKSGDLGIRQAVVTWVFDRVW